MKKLAYLLLLLATVSACCPCRKGSKMEKKPLQGTQWVLIQKKGFAVDSKEGKYSIKIDEKGAVSGLGDCNRIMGKCNIDGKSTIKFDQMASSRAMCQNAKDEMEFMQLLDATDRYSIDAQLLMLFQGDKLLGVFQAKDN